MTTQKFKLFTARPYAEQAKAFLNAYWKDRQGDAESIWKWYHKFVELDLQKGKEGLDLDEFNAHRFLESLGETKTVKEMRESIIQSDLDFNKRLALIEYCLWKFKYKVEDFVSRPQGDSAEIQQLSLLLQQIQSDIEEGQRKAEDAANKAKYAAEKAEEAAKQAAEALSKEKSARSAEDELKAALSNLKAQEDAYHQKTEDLKKKSEQGGVVSQNRAKAELAQHFAEDPLPLRKAKISTEAATKKAEKARKEAEQSRTIADKGHLLAVETQKEAEDAAKLANDAVDELLAKFKEAEKKLEEAKLAGAGHGNIWWMERELAEVRKFLPTKAKLKANFG